MLIKQQEQDVSEELTSTTACRGRDLNSRPFGTRATTLPLSYSAIIPNSNADLHLLGFPITLTLLLHLNLGKAAVVINNINEWYKLSIYYLI